MTRMTLMDSGSSAAVEVMKLVRCGDSKSMVQFLQSADALTEDLNTPDKNGRTCLSYAVSNGDSAMVDLLLATEVPDPNIADSDGNTPLVYAVSLGNSTITGKLLKYEATHIDQPNDNGFTALMKAAIHGHHSCVELLLAAGADIDARDYRRDMNALQWAELCASKSCIKILKRQKPQTLKKTHLKHAKEGGERAGPLKKIKDSLAGINHKHTHKEHRGMESLLACVTAPTIPMIIANANPLPLLSDTNGHELVDTKMSPPKKSMMCSAATAPRIEITTDTGECIIPKKNFFNTPPKKLTK